MSSRPVVTRLARADWGLVVAAGGLSVVGALLVWSATHEQVGPPWPCGTW
ncbi:hypothetical protein [Ornithinimicrobium sp. W1665]